MRILITGGAGFIGSAVVRKAIKEGHTIKNIDKLTYAACLESLDSICDHPNYSFEKIDVCNRDDLIDCFNRFKPDAIMHLAAESHVDRSIDAPSTFIYTNIIGTYEILELIGLNQTSEYKWQPYDSVGGFFVTGHTASTNLNMRGASDDGSISYNINYGNLEDKGFTRENSLRRNTLSFGGRAALSNGFTINGTLNYSQTNFKSPPVAAGYGSNVGGEGASVFANVFYTPRSVDLMGLPNTCLLYTSPSPRD